MIADVYNPIHQEAKVAGGGAPKLLWASQLESDSKIKQINKNLSVNL